MLFTECISAKPLPDPHHLRSCMKSVSCQYENEGGNEGENEGGSQIKTKSLIESNLLGERYFILNEHVSYSMNMIGAQGTHDHDSSAIGLFLSTDGNRSLCSMADSSWLSVINRSDVGAIDLAGSEI